LILDGHGNFLATKERREHKEPERKTDSWQAKYIHISGSPVDERFFQFLKKPYAAEAKFTQQQANHKYKKNRAK
jgi:hypothetical protein